ncbi:hypothetical protein [Nocardia sp. NPDC004415]
MKHGVILCGAPDIGKDTVTTALTERDARYRFHLIGSPGPCDIDRQGLSELLADGFVPVVHVDRPGAVDAVKGLVGEVRWAVVLLVADLASARARAIGHGTADGPAACEATPAVVFTATLATAHLTPGETARYIDTAVRMRERLFGAAG